MQLIQLLEIELQPNKNNQVSDQLKENNMISDKSFKYWSQCVTIITVRLFYYVWLVKLRDDGGPPDFTLKKPSLLRTVGFIIVGRLGASSEAFTPLYVYAVDHLSYLYITLGFHSLIFAPFFFFFWLVVTLLKLCIFRWSSLSSQKTVLRIFRIVW